MAADARRGRSPASRRPRSTCGSGRRSLGLRKAARRTGRPCRRRPRPAARMVGSAARFHVRHVVADGGEHLTQAAVLLTEGVHLGLAEECMATVGRTAERAAVRARRGDDDPLGRAEIADQRSGIAGGNDDHGPMSGERFQLARELARRQRGRRMVADLACQHPARAMRADFDEHDVVRSRLRGRRAYQCRDRGVIGDRIHALRPM